MRRRMGRALGLALLLAGAVSFGASASQNGEWAMSENGKYWMYYYSPSETAKDEWIEDNGKIYYVDSQGRMKTGWVRRESDGKRYYMGADGAMRFNTFAEDGRYVGPDGAELPNYDDYRKAARRILEDASEYAGGGSPGFLFRDLNEDGIQDLVITDGTGQEAQPLLVSVWDREKEKFTDAARFDPEDVSQIRRLYPGDGWYPTVLEILWAEGDVQVFQLEDQTFAIQWDLTTRPDEWGTRTLYKDGVSLGWEDWQKERQAALSEEKGALPSAYLPADEASISAAVDRVLTPDEADLWEE